MSVFVLHHGPVTITIEGLPDTVLPESVTLDLNIHSGFHEGGYREHIDAFAQAFTELGGTATFPQADPASPYSCASYATSEGLTSRLTLHPPHAPSRTAAGEDAIHVALTHQQAVEDAEIEAHDRERH